MGQSESGTLDLKGETRLDPASESRQNKLFNDAGDMSRANLYENQYGIASDMPGMGRMTQRGQEYLTDSILGRGEYANNLGFTDYTRPEDAPVPTDAIVALNQAEMDARAQAQLEWQEQQYRNNQNSYDSNRASRNYNTGQTPLNNAGSKTVVNPYGGSMSNLTAESGASQSLLSQGYGGRPSGYGSSGVGIGEMQDAALATRNMLRERGPTPQAYQSISASQVRAPNVSGSPQVQAGRVNQPGSNYVSQSNQQSIGSTRVGSVSDIRNDGQYSAPRGSNLGLGLDRGDAYDTMNAARGGVPPAGVSARSVTPDNIVSPLGLTAAELTKRQLDATTLADFKSSVSSTAIDPLSANAFGGISSLTEPEKFKSETIVMGTDEDGLPITRESRPIDSYMNTAGVDAQIAQAKVDYNEALNVEKSRQAQVGAFGARGTVEEAGLIGDQERNIAQIRGAGFDRAAQMMEADAGRRQQAGLQSQQLGMQSGLAGQALQAQRAESNAARAQQAALQGQQLGSQQQMQTQQLAQVGDIRNAELGLQADMQTQQLGMQGQLATQGLDADFEREKVRLGTQAAMQTQALGSDAYMQGQQLGTQVGLQNAQNEMRAAEQNQQAALQRGDRQAQIDAQRQMRTAELRSQQAMQTQQLGAQAGMQTQQLGTEVSVQNAQNQMRAAEQNQQAALQRNDQQAALTAQAQLANAEMRLTAATRNQASGLQARGMSLDANAQFRQQQLAAAGQLADIGGMTQDATFAGAGQLRQMGAEQDQTRMMQQAFDYEQWLRGQEGGAQGLALMQGFLPSGAQQTYQQRPSLAGQIGGGLLSAAGIGADVYKTFRGP